MTKYDTTWRIDPTKYQVNDRYWKVHAKAMKIYQTRTLWHRFRSPHIFEIKETQNKQKKHHYKLPSTCPGQPFNLMSKLTHTNSECRQLVFPMQVYNFYQPRRGKKTSKQHKNTTMLHDDKYRHKAVGSKS